MGVRVGVEVGGRTLVGVGVLVKVGVLVGTGVLVGGAGVGVSGAAVGVGLFTPVGSTLSARTLQSILPEYEQRLNPLSA